MQFLISFLYSVGRISLGLLVHPYQTMQSLVEEKLFVWMSVLPMGILAVVTVFWRYILVPVVRSVFSCSQTGFIGCEYLSFFSNWITFFILYWQIILLYLLFRFRLTWRRSASTERL